MITLQVEKLESCLEEMKPLLLEHYKEVHAFPDKIPFNPDYSKYEQLEQNDMLHIATVRDKGRLIGYCVSMLVTNLHYSDHVYAINDVVYLDKDYRGSNVAYDMIKFAESCYKALGVSVMTIHMKTKLPFVRLCEAIGMERLEYLYGKYIGE